MITKVYIQKGEHAFVDDFAYAAYMGFTSAFYRDRGLTVKVFDDVDAIPVSKSNMVIGFVGDTKVYFEKLGLTIPDSISMPGVLTEMINRKIQMMTMREFKDTRNTPIFVKPAFVTKGFDSGVIQQESSKQMLLGEVPDDMLVMTSSIIDIEGEWRVFVNRKKIIGMRHYHVGGWFAFPDRKYIEQCLALMNTDGDMPVSYTMDFAVLKNGSTEFLECNDGWAVASYGLDELDLCQFFWDRWVELTKDL